MSDTKDRGDGCWPEWFGGLAEEIRQVGPGEKLPTRGSSARIDRITPTHDQIGGPMPDAAGWRYTEHWGDVWPW